MTWSLKQCYFYCDLTHVWKTRTLLSKPAVGYDPDPVPSTSVFQVDIFRAISPLKLCVHPFFPILATYLVYIILFDLTISKCEVTIQVYKSGCFSLWIVLNCSLSSFFLGPKSVTSINQIHTCLWNLSFSCYFFAFILCSHKTQWYRVSSLPLSPCFADIRTWTKTMALEYRYRQSSQLDAVLSQFHLPPIITAHFRTSHFLLPAHLLLWLQSGHFIRNCMYVFLVSYISGRNTIELHNNSNNSSKNVSQLYQKQKVSLSMVHLQ